MNEPLAPDRRSYEIGTRVALVEQALEFIRNDQGEIKTGQTLILGRLDTFINQVGVQSGELTATPAGRVVADRLTELDKTTTAQEGRIGELVGWRDEIRGAVRLLSIFSALGPCEPTRASQRVRVRNRVRLD